MCENFYKMKMRTVSVQQLIELQQNRKNIRNICILAHVDHGKTTVADCLIASNRIISERLAGKLRYLDSRKDEQERGITMKSSAISLHFTFGSENYLINLIDSPGHVDFYGEVSTAVRLCDGAIILVDVVEGICPQTKVALRQAWTENIHPILVLNKIDRLIIERKLTPLDAYIHLQQLLEQVNAVIGELFTTEVLTRSNKTKEAKLNAETSEVKLNAEESLSEAKVFDWSSGLDETDDSSVYFSPEQGNVIFGSALDGWAFSITDFVRLYCTKLGVKENVLKRTLWGDFFLNSKAKKIMKGAQVCRTQAYCAKFGTRIKEHIFNVQVVSFVLLLDFLACSTSDDAAVIVCISKMFPVERKELPQYRQRPLTVEEIANRREEARQRHVEKLVSSSGSINEPSSTVVDVTSVPSPEADTTFIAFARVFSGRLRKGQSLYVLGPKHDPSSFVGKDCQVDPNLTLKDLHADQHVTVVTISNLYLLMGKELESLESVPAGNVLGIGGLEEHVLKSATLSSSIYCPPFIDLHMPTIPILRVAIEPVRLSDMPALVHGMKLLNQADPSVQVLIQETGEHVLVTAGEVHLAKCITDLQERFAKIEINVSPPIVPFRETVVLPPKVDMVNEAIEDRSQTIKQGKEGEEDIRADGCVKIQTPNRKCTICIRAAPLPEEVTKLLERNGDILKVQEQYVSALTRQSKEKSSLTAEGINKLSELRKKIINAFNRAGSEWTGAADQIWSFGPRHCGPNVLLNKVPGYTRASVWYSEYENMEVSSTLLDYDHSFISGFQLASLAGPLCEEPMMGVCFIVENWVIEKDHLKEHTCDNDLVSRVAQEFSEISAELAPSSSNFTSISVPFGPFTGQIMSIVKEGCRRAFQNQPQRLMSAMYSCNIQVTKEALGKMYAVLGRRHGRVLSGDIQEGSQTFNVTAVLPVIESFDFCNEIRKQTSGLAMPQLVFSHWELVDVDPFWVPTTEEEYTHFGEKADTENRARKYMNGVRRRKGLTVDEKIVEFAEKQRTLTKNK
ncbi:elongation factor-like GTPase 1 [Tachypleus tridentatus]|uniref:elongation factor-like GTPase 1 n=1 Tax=Tachypleus tridentatus TaxID=6853 RepID=UPI003FD68D15